MSLTEECEKHEMIGCRYCNPRPEPEMEADSAPFMASYDGTCPICEEPIVAYTHRILFHDFETYRGVIHEQCA